MQHAVNTEFATSAAVSPRIDRLCLAILYVKGDGHTEPPLQELMRAAQQQPGVERAEHAPTSASVVTIAYDRAKTRGSRIVESLRQAGFNALIVGC